MYSHMRIHWIVYRMSAIECVDKCHVKHMTFVICGAIYPSLVIPKIDFRNKLFVTRIAFGCVKID